MDIEITVWAVNATTPAHVVTPVKSTPANGAADSVGRRTLFDPAKSQEVDAAVVQRDQMQSGQTVQGPAAIIEDETTIIVPGSRCAIKQPDGCIDITVAN